MSVCCECCVLSGRGLCDELITRTEEFYRLWCVGEALVVAAKEIGLEVNADKTKYMIVS